MINFNSALDEFFRYTEQFKKNPKIDIKRKHSLRVMKNCEKLAIYLGLNNEEIELAKLIGLLHDIGRFEQINKYNTFLDRNSVNHAELGIKILFEDNKIRDFIQTNQYDNLIRTSILNHNYREISNDIRDDKILLYCKIIRDADKIDIFPVVINDGIENAVVFDIDDISKENLTCEIMKDCLNHKSCRKEYMKTNIDCIVVWISYIYNLNFNYSLKIIKDNNYIDKMIKLVNYKNEKTNNDMEKIRVSVHDYINSKV